MVDLDVLCVTTDFARFLKPGFVQFVQLLFLVLPDQKTLEIGKISPDQKTLEIWRILPDQKTLKIWEILPDQKTLQI